MGDVATCILPHVDTVRGTVRYFIRPPPPPSHRCRQTRGFHSPRIFLAVIVRGVPFNGASCCSVCTSGKRCAGDEKGHTWPAANVLYVTIFFSCRCYFKPPSSLRTSPYPQETNQTISPTLSAALQILCRNPVLCYIYTEVDVD